MRVVGTMKTQIEGRGHALAGKPKLLRRVWWHLGGEGRGAGSSALKPMRFQWHLRGAGPGGSSALKPKRFQWHLRGAGRGSQQNCRSCGLDLDRFLLCLYSCGMWRGDQCWKTMRRFEIPEGIRFITFSCEKRLPLLRHPKIADLFSSSLMAAKRRHRFELFAWVLMPEHVHLLVRPAAGVGLSPALKAIKQSVSLAVLDRWRALNAPILKRLEHDGVPRFWMYGGGYDRNVRHAGELSKDVRYIHHNPVRRGLCRAPADWKWSSAAWWESRPVLLEPLVLCDPLPRTLFGTWNGAD